MKTNKVHLEKVNRQDARKALAAGKKITHDHMMSGEWVKMKDYNTVVFEDSCEQDMTEFWDLRIDPTWNDGWYIIEEAPFSVKAGPGMSPKDWIEDFEHENGKYMCHCLHCQDFFFGHKRRQVCKECEYK